MMDADPDTAVTNPTLRIFFRQRIYGKSITFTKDKIRHLIESELAMNTSTWSEFIFEVILDAFMYFLNKWPKWKYLTMQNMDFENDLLKFKEYMKIKIYELINKENYYLKKFANEENNVHLLPEEVKNSISKTNTDIKLKLPYSVILQGTVDQLFNMEFENGEGDDVKLIISKPISNNMIMSPRQILSLPYVTILFDIPNVISIRRTNLFKIDRFLCKMSDKWKYPEQEFILAAVKRQDSTQIFTYQFMTVFLGKLNDIIKGYTKVIRKNIDRNIRYFCNEILNDIAESNMCNKTIKEKTEVLFNMGSGSFFEDSYSCSSYTQHKKDTSLILRTVLTPAVQYCLWEINGEKNCTSDNSTYFDFEKFNCNEVYNYLNLTEEKKKFAESISNSLSYYCVLCKSNYSSFYTLANHIKNTHPLKNSYCCTKCAVNIPANCLLENRWVHVCAT